MSAVMTAPNSEYQSNITAGTNERTAHQEGGLPVEEQEKWVREVRFQPAWRYQADIECDYYDGNQLNSSVLSEMEERGIPPLWRNFIAPAVDSVLGMEAINRTDLRVRPDKDGDDEDLAEALNVKFSEAARVGRMDQATSDTYAGQVKAGLQWLEVGRESNPFKEDYRIKTVHRREIWWDWLSKEPDLSDARYLIRKRWIDTDIARLMFPKHEGLIDQIAAGWHDIDWELRESHGNTWLARAWDVEQNYSIEEMQWISPERDRIAPYEMWYRQWSRNTVIKDPASGYVTEFDKNNQFHVAAVQQGLVKYFEAVYPKMRLSWWLGPHRVADIPSPYPHSDFPYVPFWGKKEDRTGVPYGLIRAMMSPQDESNARLSKMMWLLSAKRVIADDDAVLNGDHDTAAQEISRPDAYIKLNQNRVNRDAGAFRVEDDMQLSSQQFDVMKDAQQAIQDVAGVYNQMMGKDGPNGTAASSGVAIQSLVQQGTITLAEINDNYRYARIKAGELLLSLVKEDIGRDPMEVVVGRKTTKQRTVMVNGWDQDKQGNRIKTNDAIRTKMSMALDEVPNTPTYRAQNFNQIGELVKSLPPELQALLVPMWIDASDYPNKEEAADMIRNAIGTQKPLDQMDDQEKAEAQKKMEALAKDQEFQAKLRALELRTAEGKARVAEADANLKEANTEKSLAQSEQIQSDIDHHDETHGMDLAERANNLINDDEDKDHG